MTNHAEHLADVLGRRAIAAAVNVGPQAVSNAIGRRSFPASWYPALKALCAANGQACPEEAFTFKPSSLAPSEVT
jgi:hypothetical protein